jgi:hypothetical protein
MDVDKLKIHQTTSRVLRTKQAYFQVGKFYFKQEQ